MILSLNVDNSFLCLSFNFFFTHFTESLPAVPENITVTFISPTSVKISWQTLVTNQLTSKGGVEKYDITYKPTNARYV